MAMKTKHLTDRLTEFGVTTIDPCSINEKTLETLASEFGHKFEPVTEEGDCKYCDQSIARGTSGKWTHQDPDAARGCYAASYRPETGWDEALLPLRKKVATPKKR